MKRRPPPGTTAGRKAIAAAHGTTWTDLYRADARTVGTDPDRLRPGQRLALG
ncbi:hypothetical protein [Streptomyces sp. x-19]|uniref:hypothetical protein n=1 Tax=Streptomyces sp. x-19 TaxID=2789280 RepID=UPI0039809AFE